MSSLPTPLRRQLERAIDLALNTDNIRTKDLGGSASTQDFTQAVLKRLAA